MADNLETLEREVAESRSRLADTLDRLTSPETSEAVKRDLMDTVHKAKDEVLNRARDTGRQTAQGFADSLKQRAMDNPFAVALIGAGIAWRLYKKPPVATLLVGAGVASLMMSGGSGRKSADRDAYRNPRRQGYVPGGVAGYGYPVEEDAPGPSVAERVSAAASSAAERARNVASTTATHVLEAARNADERARTAGVSAAAQISNSASGAAAQVSETAADVAAQVSTTVSSVAKQVSETVSDTAGRIRMAASDAMERTSSRVSDVGSSVADTTSGTTDRMIDLLDRAQRNPAVLGAVGLAAGFSIARSVRATDMGERVLDYTTDAVGEGARRMASGVTHVASRAADTAGSLAASTRAMAADLGATARQTFETAGSAVASAASRASEATSSSFEGVRDRAAGTSRSATKTASASSKSVGERARSGSRGRADRDHVSRPTPGLSRQVQDELYELGRRYPLLLGAVGLAVGAALGGVLDPTETENRMLGEASDRLKQRARTMAGEQYEQIADSAKQIAERILQRPEAAEAGADAHGAPPGADNASSHPVERPNERAAMEAQRQGLGPV